MTQLAPEWIALINFCQENDYVTFENLEIRHGKPDIGVVPYQITPVTKAKVSVKFRK